MNTTTSNIIQTPSAEFPVAMITTPAPTSIVEHSPVITPSSTTDRKEEGFSNSGRVLKTFEDALSAIDFFMQNPTLDAANNVMPRLSEFFKFRIAKKNERNESSVISDIKARHMTGRFGREKPVIKEGKDE